MRAGRIAGPALLVIVTGFVAGVPGIVFAGSPLDRLDPERRSQGGGFSIGRPVAGDWELRLLAPDVIEMAVVTSKQVGRKIKEWDWVDGRGRLRLPGSGSFRVTIDGRRVRVKRVGFRRRVAYAPLGEKLLRIGNHLFLQLAQPVAEGAVVRVRNPSGNAWPRRAKLKVETGRERWSPAIHVSHAGYEPGLPKKALVGYYLGSLGELRLRPSLDFRVARAADGRTVMKGVLERRIERGFTDMTLPYRQVFEADFSKLDEPGEYRIVVPGIGRSFPFRIHPAVSALVTRTLALGMYHQRCGAAVGLPWTRFIHGPCHKAPALVPSDGRGTSHDKVRNPRYGYNRTGFVDVSGGHHDAGDYSKYLINSAKTVHALILAVDAFPGVSELDNLGLPESGDGKSDLLQLAKWEADFIARMQDEDGGFYFLVYPRNRNYEHDVTPDHGDPQVVFPKQTAVTAAATAALAQASSSPALRRAFPAVATDYLSRAEKGWHFLKRAWKKHGRKGAYQEITHYGAEFEDRDEVIWAAMELALATGSREYLQEIRDFDPSRRSTWLWQWWRLYEGYGAAVRSCALSGKTGRAGADRLPKDLLSRCRKELEGGADELVRYTSSSTYRTGFWLEGKRFRTSGWYFSGEHLFDLAAAFVMKPKPALLASMVGNRDYQFGANPVNLSYVTGIGWKRPIDLVSGWAPNDERVLPPSGIPVGDVISGYGWIQGYGHERGKLSFPPDNHKTDPYPLYDRWTDSWNTTAEFVIAVQARSLAGAAFLMARSPEKDRPWKTPWARIAGVSDRITVGTPVIARIDVPGMELDGAVVTWEASGMEPSVADVLSMKPESPGVRWIEAEVLWPDGRRAFARHRFLVVGKPAKTRHPADR